MTAIHRRVAACRAGTDQTLVAQLASGWVVMGDPQVITGYCLLLPDPVAPDLSALSPDGQIAFLADMARLGTALRELTGAVRVNYAIFGNLEPALHAHVFPRRASEPAGLRTAHPWAWDWSKAPAFDRDRDGPLLAALRARLSGGPVFGPGPPQDP